MANKTLQTRITNRHATSDIWKTKTSFVPMNGEICIYTDINRIKIGNGKDTIVNLPFLGGGEPEYTLSLSNGVLTISKTEGTLGPSYELNLSDGILTLNQIF